VTSLRARLSSNLALVLTLLVLSLLLLAWLGLRSITENFVAARLQHDLEALISELQFDRTLALRLAPDAMGRIYQQPYSGHYFKAVSGEQVLRSRSLWDADLPLPTPDRESRRLILPGPGEQQLLVLTQRVALQNQPVVVAVAEDIAPLGAGLRRLMLVAVLVSLTGLGVLLALQHRIVVRGLRPLETARRQVAALSEGAIRQLDPDTPSEIRPLVLELNRLLTLTETRLTRSRHALGNLAHALKTPLTVILQLAEHLPGENGRLLRQQGEAIRQLMERELRRARIAGAPVPGQRVLLITEVDDLVDTLRRIYRARDLWFQQRIPPDSQFPGDRDDLLELLGNLLDNACQHARREIRVTVTRRERLLLAVEDDGPGCAPETLETLTRRGQRADERGQGHGLGLAIVTEIVQQYGGELWLDTSPELGGLRVTVELPRPATPSA